MKKISIYLDTSIINFLFAADAPELKRVTQIFFENYIKTNIYDIYISPIVIDEIAKTNDDNRKNKLLNVIKIYNLKIIDIAEKKSEIERLATI